MADSASIGTDNTDSLKKLADKPSLTETDIVDVFIDVSMNLYVYTLINRDTQYQSVTYTHGFRW